MFVKISVIIPTYNESRNVQRLVREIRRVLPRSEIVVVDDNSPDGTGAVVNRLARRDPEVRLVERIGERGLGSAIIRGFREARGEVVGVIDADFSHPPAALPQLIAKFDEGYDLVIGSRYVKGGGIENWPALRKITSRIAIALARPLTGIKDPVSGFFFVRKSALSGVALSSRSWKVALDVIVKGSYARAIEVPYVFTNRQKGKSKIDAKEYARYVLHLMELVAFCLRGSRKTSS